MTEIKDHSKLIAHSYHPELKVFGTFREVFEYCDKISEEQNLIKKVNSGRIKYIENKLKQGFSKIEIDNSTYLYSPKADERYDKIKNMDSIWDVRELKNKGYDRIRLEDAA